MHIYLLQVTSTRSKTNEENKEEN